MLGARPFALAEDPLLRSTTDRIAAQLAILPPKLQLIDDGFPRAFVVGRGPRSSTARRQLGSPDGTHAERAGCRARARALARPQPRRPHPDLRRPPLDHAARGDAAGRLPLAVLLAVLAPVASAFTHLSFRRSASSRPTGRERRSATRTTSRMRSSASIGAAELVRVHCVARDRAALHREPVRPRGARRAHVRDAPAVDDRVARLRPVPE